MSSSSTTTISSSATASCTAGHLLKFTQYLLNIYSILLNFTHYLQHHVRQDRQLPDRHLQLPE